MHAGLTLITAPVIEPVTLQDAKNFLKIDTTDDDNYVSALTGAARKFVESYLKRALITQTWEMWLDHFPYDRSVGGRWWDGVVERPISYIQTAGREVELPMSPLYSTSFDGTTTFLKTYDLSDTVSVFDPTKLIFDTAGFPGRIALKFGEIWPVNLRLTNSVQIRYQAGYGPTNSYIPQDIVHAIKLMIGHMYEKREPTESGRALSLPFSVDCLLQPYRILRP